MPYIGRTVDGFGVRNRFLYLASASDTSVSGADANGATLTFTDGAYVDVYLNGVLLKAGTDYNTNTANTIAGISSMSANDEVTVIVYDVFTVGDMVSATSGGDFIGRVNFTGGIGGSGGNLVLKNTDTADDSFPTFTLQTGDTDIASGDVLGRIAFQAPDEGTGTDAIVVPVNIEAVSQGDFSASNNATSLIINTSTTSEAGTAGDGGKFSFIGNGEFIIKSMATTDDNYPVLSFQTGETDIAADDILGFISFTAPDEATGSDANLVAASILARSEGDFSASSNATSLEFRTGASEAATTKMTLTSAGRLGVGLTDPSDLFEVSNSADTPTRAIITAEDSSGSNQNAFIKTKAKGNYYEGLEMASTSGHIGMWGGYYSGSAIMQARVGGSGINSSDNIALNINSNGHVFKPSQPLTVVRYAANTEQGSYNAGSNRNQVICKPSDVQINQGSHFNTGTGQFTCPVDGTYRVSFMGNYLNNDVSNYVLIQIRKNGSSVDQYYQDDLGTWNHVIRVAYVTCSANDTLEVYNNSDSSGSSKGGFDIVQYTAFNYSLVG